MTASKILVVEDDLSLQAALSYSLTKDGYQVTVAKDGAEAINQFHEKQPDLVLLDIMLPVMSGLEVCRIIRKESGVPIIMLTARAEEMDKITGLDLGADDYVTKPFSMRELLARVRALLRREHNSPLVSSGVLIIGDIAIDTARHSVKKSGQSIELTPKEFDLLTFLAQNKGLVFSRDQLLEKVWGYDFAGNTRTVDVHVRWLREKIEPDPENPRHLLTVRGTGYKLEA
jgi:two-component system, OmpR family, response regulator